MPRTLYIIDGSTPARAAWMAFLAAGIDVNIRRMDLPNCEQYADWFIKMNPRHCVPTLDDDGFYLWESRAIMRYAMNAYAPSSTLYPNDPKERALVDRAIDYEISKLYPLVAQCVHPVVFGMAPEPPQDKVTSLMAELAVLDKTSHLDGDGYLTGDHVTIADISTIAALTFLETIDFDFLPYPNIADWMVRMKQQQFYVDGNQGFETWKAMLKTDTWKETMKARNQKLQTIKKQ